MDAMLLFYRKLEALMTASGVDLPGMPASSKMIIF
jgi:hypothetical protein